MCRIIESTCCAPETNITLYVNYISIKTSGSLQRYGCLWFRSFYIFQMFENKSLCTYGYNCQSFLLSLLPLCSCLFSLSAAQSNTLLVTSRKAELGEGQKQCYVETKICGILRIIQTWNKFSSYHFYLSGLVTDSRVLSPPMKWW